MQKRFKLIKKVAIYSGFAVFILLGLIIIIFDDPTITSATVGVGEIKCLDPATALNYINSKGCTRVYEDPACEAQGNVVVSCPVVEPAPAVTPTAEEPTTNENTEKTSKSGWKRNTQRHRPFYNFSQFLRWLWYKSGGSWF